jgi:signal transduction histidine kinase
MEPVRPSVLIVEDERIIAKNIKEMLLGNGYDVTAIAATSDEAIARASERCPDVVLMDIRIKGPLDGIVTAGTLWERFRTPIIYLTAQADEATVERAKHTRPAAYLVKPIKYAELRIALEVAIERRAMENSLRAALAESSRANVELQQFAYVASHDLRAPLRAIDSLTSWIEEDLKDQLTDEARTYMSLLRGRVGRMERLLIDLLDYARVGAGAQAVEMVDVASLIDGVMNLAHLPDGFVVEIEPPMPTFETARVPLQRILLNLITNAVKHHDRVGGRVKVAVQDVGAFWTFVVSDDGPGIPEDFWAKAFQMFQTLKPRDVVEGSGMGLAFVKKLVEGAGGEVSIESRGRGTSVRFGWPKCWSSPSTPPS